MAYAFEYNGTEYFLEFDRESIERAEQVLDLSMNEVTTYKLTNMKKLFHAALLKHHRNIKASTVDMLYKVQEDKMDLHADLMAMYSEAIEASVESEGNGVTRREI